MPSLLDKLESSRRELLDLGLRNPLLNYRLSKARGVHVVDESPAFVFDILVNQNKAMSFVGRVPNGPNDGTSLFPEIKKIVTENSLTDSKLQTNDSDSSLQTRLLNTYYAARTSIEEQGVNILFLALGMLNWYEAENSQEVRKAPLILIPVELERTSARELFKLKFTGEEVGANISLQAKLKTEFVIDVPALPEMEDLNIESYFRSIEKSVRNKPAWSVDFGSIELGFFSFGKFLLYNDLDNSKWPEDKKPINNPLLKQLFETGFSEPSISSDDSSFIDEDTNADQLFQVLDADSSQVLAQLAINEGRNLVIQGPPGTGKSQTICNIISNAVGQGKTVLFVAEKMAALEVVKRRLDNIGLGDICLELHSHKANKKDLHAELMKVLCLGKPKVEELKQQIAQLKEIKKELNDYCNTINSTIDRTGLSAHQIIGNLLKIEKESNPITLPKIEISDVEKWDVLKFKKAESFSERIEARLKEVGVPSLLAFYGSQLEVLLPTETTRLNEIILNLINSFSVLNSKTKEFVDILGLPSPKLLSEIQMLADLAGDIFDRPALSGINVENENWILKEAKIFEAISKGRRLNKVYNEIEQYFIQEIWQKDVTEIRQIYAQYGDKWYKFMVGSYRKSRRELKGYCKSELPKDIHESIRIIDEIIEGQRLLLEIKEIANLGAEMFGDHWKGIRSDWAYLERVGYIMNKIYRKIGAGIYPDGIIKYLSSLKTLV